MADEPNALSVERRLELAAELSEVRRLNDWLRVIAEEHGWSDQLANDIKLCLNEAVANILDHSFAQGADGWTQVTITEEDKAVRVVLRDDGFRFDPLSLPIPETPTDIADAQIGGLGVKLIRQTASDVYYRHDGTHNVLAMRFDKP
ncbi:MAG: ATP-binding protein [Pseudomonadota bacterium]